MSEEMVQFFKCRSIRPPRTYYIELTNLCNFRCSMCNFHSAMVTPVRERQRGFMDIRLARRIVDQIGSFGETASVAFHGAGESLLHRGLIEILNYASKHKNIYSGFLTNGMLLDDEMSTGILDSGISWIGFSLDGIDKEKFERYRIGSDFERIMKNIELFLEMKKKKCSDVSTKVNMTVQDDMKDDVDKFIDFWLNRVDEVLISPCKPIGSRESSLIDKTVERIPCYMLKEMMVIYWDGKVGLCCEDWFNDGNLGDATREKVISIWEGKRFNVVRKLHEKGKSNKIPLCKGCNSWYNAIGDEYFDEKRGCRVQKNAWQYIYRKH